MKKKFTATPSNVTASTDSTASDNLLGAYSEWYKVANDKDLADYGVNSSYDVEEFLESEYGIEPIGIAVLDFDKLDEIKANELSNEGYDMLTIGKSDDGEITLYMTYGDGTATTVTLDDIYRVFSQDSFNIDGYPDESDVHSYIKSKIDEYMEEYDSTGFVFPESAKDEIFEMALNDLKTYLAYGDLAAWLYVDKDPYQLTFQDTLDDFEAGYPDTVIEDSVYDYALDHGYEDGGHI